MRAEFAAASRGAGGFKPAGIVVEGNCMSEVNVHRVQPAWKKNALIDNETYLKWYADSVKNPDKFWGKHGKRIDWFKPYKQGQEHLLRPARSRSNGSRTGSSTSPTIASTGI